MDKETIATNEKHKVVANIYGIRYTMRTAHTDEEVGKIVDFLNEKMEAVAVKQPTLQYNEIVILAALNIAEEFINMKEDYDQLLSVINENQ